MCEQKVLAEQWRAKPEGEGVVRRLGNLQSLTNTVTQLLDGDAAEPL